MGKDNEQLQKKQQGQQIEKKSIQTDWVVLGSVNGNLVENDQALQMQEQVNDHLILGEQPMVVDNVLAPVNKKVQKPIKLNKMQRAARKVGLATKEQKAEYEAYIRQQEQQKKQSNEAYRNGIAKVVNKIKELGSNQGNAFDKKTHRLNKENPFLKKIQIRGDKDDRELDKYGEGRKFLTRYKDETDGRDLDYVPMNMLLRGNKFSNKFKGVKKTCKQIFEEEREKNKKISSDERKAITRKKQSECAETVEATKKAIETIDNFSLKEDMALFRYTGLGALASMLGLKGNASELDIVSRLVSSGGKELIIRDKAFMSTTIFQDAAAYFKMKSPVRFKILGKKGTKAYNISRMHGLNAHGGKDHITSTQDEEQEMLLQAGTQLRVIHIDIKNSTEAEKKRTKSTKIFTVYVETIPQVKKSSNSDKMGA